MTASRPMRAALYARVSTANHGQDVGLQLDELRQIAAQRGWTVYREFEDTGVSGTKTSRPALDAMLADAQAGRFDVLMIWKLDRLGRSLQHLLAVISTLNAAGVGLASVRDPGIDTTSPTGRLLLQLLGCFAEFEREQIRERVIAGVRRAQAAGKHCGRPRRELDLRAAKVLLAQDHSVREVADMLGLPRATLQRRLREVGISTEPGGPEPQGAEAARSPGYGRPENPARKRLGSIWIRAFTTLGPEHVGPS